MPRTVILLLCALVATGCAAARAITAEKVESLRQVRVVAVEIKQDWAWSADDETEKNASSEKKLSELLPLAEYTRTALEFAGWKIAAPGEPAGVRLVIETFGHPLDADYVGTVMGRNYSGAELSGDVTLFDHDVEVLHEKFEGTIHPPTSINRFYSRQRDAPYERLLPDCLEAVYKMEEAVFGLPPILAALKKNEDEHRTAAARVLFAHGDAAAGPAVAELLRDRDERLGTIAATALGAFGDASTFPALLAALRDDPGYPAKPADLSEEELNRLTQFDHELETADRRDQAKDVVTLERHEAVQWALLQNPAPDKVRRLAALLRDRSAPPMARRGAALVLGPLQDPVATEALLAALKDESFVVRAAAISALGSPNYQGQRPVAVALLALANDTQPYVRSRARAVLGDFALALAEQSVNARSDSATAVREGIGRALEDPDPLVRLGAVRLTQYSAENWTDELGRRLRSEPVAAVRDAAVDMLFERHRPELEPVIAQALGDPDESTRLRALKALDASPENYGEDGPITRPPLPESAVNPLLALLDADVPSEAAGRVLQRVQGEGVNVVLLAAAQRDGTRPAFREMVVIELARRGDRRATPLIAALLNRAEALRLGYVLVEVAARLDDPALLDPLFAVVRQGAPASRTLAVRVLGGMSHTRSVGPLIAALRPAENSDGELAGTIREALHNLTGQDHGGSNGWLRWWKENSGKPIVRPAPRKSAEEPPAEKTPEEKPEQETEEPKSG